MPEHVWAGAQHWYNEMRVESVLRLQGHECKKQRLGGRSVIGICCHQPKRPHEHVSEVDVVVVVLNCDDRTHELRAFDSLSAPLLHSEKLCKQHRRAHQVNEQASCARWMQDGARTNGWLLMPCLHRTVVGLCPPLHGHARGGTLSARRAAHRVGERAATAGRENTVSVCAAE